MEMFCFNPMSFKMWLKLSTLMSLVLSAEATNTTTEATNATLSSTETSAPNSTTISTTVTTPAAYNITTAMSNISYPSTPAPSSYTSTSRPNNSLPPEEDMLVWIIRGAMSEFFKSEGYSVLTMTLADPIKAVGTNKHLNTTDIFKGSSRSRFWALSADYNRHCIYYTDVFQNYIGVFDMQAQKHHILFQGLSYGIDGLAVDGLTGNIYWTDTDLQHVMVADSTFSHYIPILNISSMTPAMIAVHPLKRSLYWSERSSTECRIYKSDLQGKNVILVHNFSDVVVIDDLTIDVTENRLYWSERVRTSIYANIRFFNLDSPQNTTTIYKSFAAQITVASYKNFLYVGNRITKSITILMKPDGKVFLEYYHMFPHSPAEMVIYGPYSQPWLADHNRKQHSCSKLNCSQLCLSKGLNSGACTCGLGYRLQEDGVTCVATIFKEDFILLVDIKRHNVLQMSLNQSDAFSMLPLYDVGSPHSVDYDPIERKVYWADVDNSRVVRSFLNGTDREVIVANITVDSIAIDPISRNLYFADSNRDAIAVMSLDLPNVTSTLKVQNIYQISKLMISHKLRKIFWSDWRQSRAVNALPVGTIESMNLDGSEHNTVANNTAAPNGITIDDEGKFLFWTEVAVGAIRWLDLESGRGGEYQIPYQGNKFFITEIAYHAGYLYFTDMNQHNLHRVASSDVISNSSASARQVTEYGPRIFYSLSSLRIITSISDLPSGSTPCSPGRVRGCPQICLPHNSTPTCVCEDISEYIKANNTCTQIRSRVDTKAPSFGTSCPKKVQRLSVDACSDATIFNFSLPVVVDDSELVVVKSRIQQPPPYTLLPGPHFFQYKAQDHRGRTATCAFSVFVSKIICANSPPIPRHGTPSKPSCSNKYGSTISVTCRNMSAPTTEFICTRSGQWRAEGALECPHHGKHSPHGPTEKAGRRRKRLSGGAIASIILIAIAAITVCVVLIWRNRHRVWFMNSGMRREDTLRLTSSGDSSSGSFNPSTEWIVLL